MIIRDYTTKIKYDLFSLRILKVVAIVSALVFALGVILLFTEIDGTEVLILVSLYIGGMLFLVSLVELIQGTLYIKRLQRYGYDLPVRKSNYGGILEKLPRTKTNDEKSVYSKYNVYAIYAALLALAFWMVMDGAYLNKWYFMKENASAMFVLFMIFNISWVIMALVMKVQSNVTKYRDDVETDLQRKIRWNPVTICVNIVILMLICTMVYVNINSMTNYVFKSKVKNEVDHLAEIQEGIKHALIMCEEDNENLDTMKSYLDLCDGIDITTWEMPFDKLQLEITDALGIEKFSDLQDDFSFSEGVAQIYVQINDDEITSKLLNPIEKISYISRQEIMVKNKIKND